MNEITVMNEKDNGSRLVVPEKLCQSLLWNGSFKRRGHLIADKGYDSDAIIEKAIAQGMQTVIPPRKNRKEQRFYDKRLYRHRHPVENAFLALKQWRGIATRYAKNLSSFIAIVQIRCLALCDLVK